MARQRRSPKKKFFVKEEDGLYTVYDKYFDEIESRDEALVIALRIVGELHNTLKDEALGGGPLFVGNMKVTTGLQRSLDELDKRWPFLLMEMRAVPRRVNGNILHVC